MELIEAVAAALPKRIELGDSIDTATWGQFIIMDDYSKYWLNDYSSYFSDVCGSSWNKAVALYVHDWPNLQHGRRHYRWVTDYLCESCGEKRSTVRSVLTWCPSFFL